MWFLLEMIGMKDWMHEEEKWRMEGEARLRLGRRKESVGVLCLMEILMID